MTQVRAKYHFIFCIGFALNCGGQSTQKQRQQSACGGAPGDVASGCGTEAGADQSGEGGADSCSRGREAYAERRAELMARDNMSACEFSVDCQLVVEDNPCTYDCAVSVPGRVSSEILDTLNSLAAEECFSCAPPGRMPCPRSEPFCFGGTCTPL